ncbi:Ig-like domain-containing protein [Microbacterium sp. NC79]|uniref:Ig-like domain-containing protein n=1 Tax=Microbacterium sp. NC79 TaxID=2851009 RepID=UPI001C2C04FC|nr:Ig-like domain-containing protein [Microbacterium sp. NC79]MBV0895951.1 Ig-like domain-containing protein [Microbacterium sp. NC79]
MTVTFEGNDDHLASTVQHTVTVLASAGAATNASVVLGHSKVDVRTAMPATFVLSGASDVPIAERAFSVAVFRYPDMTSPVFATDLRSDSAGMGSIEIPPQPVGAYVVRIIVPPTASHAPATHTSSYDVTPIVTTTTLTISPLDPSGMRPAFTDITYTATVTPAMAGIPVSLLKTSLVPPASVVLGTAITDANGVATFTARTGALSPLPEVFAAKAEPTDPNIFSSTSTPIVSAVGLRYASAVVTTPPTARMTETETSLDVIFPGAPDELAGSSVSVYRGATHVATEVVSQEDGFLRADFQIPAPAVLGPDVLNFRMTSSQPSIVTIFTYTTPTVWTLAPQNLAIEAFPSVDAMTPMPIAATVTDEGAPVAYRDLTLNVYGVDGGLPLFTTDLTTGAEGAAGAMVPPLPVGSYRATITAAATGLYDALSESVTYDVVPIASTTTLTASPTAVHGSDRTFTATVDGDDPTGLVEFVDDGTVIGTVAIVDGTASITIDTLDVGDHTIVANYRGDVRHAVSHASITATVSGWTSVVTTNLSATEALVADAVEMDVTVALIDPNAPTISRAIGSASAQANGAVELLIDGQVVGDPVALVAGAATLAVPTTTAGTFDVAARYIPMLPWVSGTDSATSTLTVSLAAQNIAIEAFASVDAMTPMPLAFIVTDSESSPLEARDVTVNIYGVDGGLPLFTTTLTTGAEGAAAVMVPPLPVGSYRVIATSPQTTMFAEATASATYDVVPIATTVNVTASPTAVHGSDRVLTATIDGENPTGVVEFVDDGTVLGTAPIVDGVATFTVNTLEVGSHTLVADYLGDDRHAPADASTTATVVAWTSTVTSQLSAAEAHVGDAVTLQVSVTLSDPTAPSVTRAIGSPSTANGTVALLIDGKIVGDAVALTDGAATLTVPATSAGSVSVSARFVPADASMTAADSAAHTLAIADVPEPTPVPTPEPSEMPTPSASVTPSPTSTSAPLASTGAGEAQGLALGVLLLMTGLAIAAGRVLRKQRT